ncbi:hypothetical protein HA402_000524 [Bradysia odoriphaga]|nr:hypothetical protein HA402_000524 [Bradysia odoriphaga]
MSKKQAIINKFFQPKTKDYVLSSVPLRIKPRSLQGVRNIQNLHRSSVVISLLSSDEEDDEVTSVNEETVNVSFLNTTKNGSCCNNETVNEVSTSKNETSISVEISLADKSDELETTDGFLEVVLQEENGSSDENENPKPKEEFADYKLNSFLSMIDWVLNDETNYHLFNEDDWTVIEHFKSMSVPSQRLYVRLYVRKHRWIRTSKISYPDIGDNLQEMFDELVVKRLLLPCNVIDNLEEVLELLDPAELKACAKSINGVNLSKLTSKQSLTDAIKKHAKSSRSIQNFFSAKSSSVEQTILHYVKKMIGSTAFCIDENSGRLFSRMCYLYYPPQVNEDENAAILSQQLFNQLKVENGELTYPTYTINKKDVIYKTRDDLVLYEIACRLESKILVGIEKKNFECLVSQHLPEAESQFHKIFSNQQHAADLLLPNYLRNQTAGHIFTRCLNHLVAVLEQLKDHARAVEVLRLIYLQEVYCQHYKGKWLERLAIDLDKHLKQPAEALEMIVNGLKDPNVKVGFRYSVYQRGQRLAKSLNPKVSISFSNCSDLDVEKCPEITITAEALARNVNGRKNIFTTTNQDGDITCIPVEEAALRHYKCNGYTKGLHSESIVYHALLNLLMWNVIYSDVPDAFRTCYQSQPLDMSFEDFYRKDYDVPSDVFDKLILESLELDDDQMYSVMIAAVLSTQTKLKSLILSYRATTLED